MKKLILTLGCVCLSLASTFAQANLEDREMGTKTQKGQVILPQAGDIAIGIDATSILKYAGNSFNGNTDNDNVNIFDYNGGIFNAPAIYMKYFITDKTAIRAKLNFDFNSSKDKDIVPKAGTTSDETVENSTTHSSNGLGLTVGYEIRRGYGRLQGYFGPEIGIGFKSESLTYDWGNALNKDYPESGIPRDLKKSKGSEFALKAGGFAGVEYFIAPKLSIGGEVSLGLGFASIGKGKHETEKWDIADEKLVKKETETGGASDFQFKAAYSGALNVTFHF